MVADKEKQRVEQKAHDVRLKSFHLLVIEVLRRLVDKGVIKNFRFTGKNSEEDRRGIDLLVGIQKNSAEVELDKKNSFCFQQKTGAHFTKKVRHHFARYKWPLYVLRVDDLEEVVESVFLLLFLASSCVVPYKQEFARSRLKELCHGDGGQGLQRRVWHNAEKSINPKVFIRS